MVYISKKKGIKDFFKTRNLKYYIAFLILFIAIIAVIVIVNKNEKPADNSEDDDHITVDETTTAYEEDTNPVARGIYRICINKSTHMVAAYAYDDKNESYSKTPSRYMIAAIGDIPDGTYNSQKGNKSSWFEADNGFYRYYSDFDDDIVFHSSLYKNMNDKNSLIVDDYNTIGSDSSNMGITLQVSDAKWIYENCSYESEIVVYSKDTEQIEADFISVTDIPDGVTWEPTDNSEVSVWCQSEIKLLDCAQELTVKTGSNLNAVLRHVNARNEADESIVSYVYITGKYNLNKAGVYNITLNLLDVYGNHLTRAVELTVEESESDADENSETEDETESETDTKESVSSETTTSDAPTQDQQTTEVTQSVEESIDVTETTTEEEETTTVLSETTEVTTEESVSETETESLEDVTLPDETE